MEKNICELVDDCSEEHNWDSEERVKKFSKIYHHGFMLIFPDESKDYSELERSIDSANNELTEEQKIDETTATIFNKYDTAIEEYDLKYGMGSYEKEDEWIKEKAKDEAPTVYKFLIHRDERLMMLKMLYSVNALVSWGNGELARLDRESEEEDDSFYI